MQTTVGRAVNSEGLRQEIWIRPDSGATNCRTLSHSNNDESTSKEDELKKLSLEQVCTFELGVLNNIKCSLAHSLVY